MDNKLNTRNFALILLAVIIALIATSCSLNNNAITGFAVKDKDGKTNETLIESSQNITETLSNNESDNQITQTINETQKEKKEKPTKDEKPEPNQPPVWESDIEEFIIDGKTLIDLNSYFSDKNNDKIAYTA